MSKCGMTFLRRLWLHHMRFWHTIDLHGALQTGNYAMMADCRNRISEIDGELDRLEIQG